MIGDPIAQLLAATGLTSEQLVESSYQERQNQSRQAVEDTPELRRIVNLPSRRLDEFPDELVTRMTDTFKANECGMTLRPIQAAALYEVFTYGGLFGIIRVGGGKTLISYLAPIMAKARAALILVPANLREKTIRDFKALSRHWRAPTHFKIESYEYLGRMQAAALLDRYRPDMFIMDECHRLKNTSAAVTKRVKRYLQQNTNTRVVAMSGTITKRSLKDFAHILRWCLPHIAPVPQFPELDEWARALDEKVSDFRRVAPGALIQLCNDEERGIVLKSRKPDEVLSAVRVAYRRRLVETPGVVATQETSVDMPLVLEPYQPKAYDTNLEYAFEQLRRGWETPDEQPIADAISMWRHARELGLGFYYRWKVRPPEEWMFARKNWAKHCRQVLKHNRRGIDSEGQLAMMIRRGEVDDTGGLLELWQRVRDTFDPETEAVWISDEALVAANKWLKTEGGIAWVEHIEFGKALSLLSGLPYYGRGGKSATGVPIEDHPSGQPMICSILSNSEGRNLQAWSKNLIMSCPPNGKQWEQMLGRTHRDGQLADEVTADLYVGSWEHVQSFWRAHGDARYAEDLLGPQKLLRADIAVPTLDDVEERGGYRWCKAEY